MGELTWMISFLHAHTLCLNIRKPCVKCAPRKRALNARAFIRNVCPNHSLCHASMTSTQIGRNFDRRFHSPFLYAHTLCLNIRKPCVKCVPRKRALKARAFIRNVCPNHSLCHASMTSTQIGRNLDRRFHSPFLHAHTLCLNIRKPCVKCVPRKRALKARAFIRNVCPRHSLCHASLTSTQIGRNFDRRFHSPFLYAHTLCLNIRKPCVKCVPRKRALKARAFIRNVCPNHSLCHASMTSTQIGRNLDRRFHSPFLHAHTLCLNIRKPCVKCVPRKRALKARAFIRNVCPRHSLCHASLTSTQIGRNFDRRFHSPFLHAHTLCLNIRKPCIKCVPRKPALKACAFIRNVRPKPFTLPRPNNFNSDWSKF